MTRDPTLPDATDCGRFAEQTKRPNPKINFCGTIVKSYCTLLPQKLIIVACPLYETRTSVPGEAQTTP